MIALASCQFSLINIYVSASYIFHATTLGKLFRHVALSQSPSSTIWYWPNGVADDALQLGKVLAPAGMAETNETPLLFL